MKRTADIRFGNLTALTLPNYNENNLMMGTSFVQRNGKGEDHFIGPAPVDILRIANPRNLATDLMDVVRWGSNIDWIFIGDNATAAATRDIHLGIYDRTTKDFNMYSNIRVTYPPTTNHTMRGLKALYDTYTTGTASVSGTAVTGVDSSWSTDRMSVGSRIGFGSNDPRNITTWYEISAVGGNTSITLTSSAGTISSGPYVIEDLQILMATTNATGANGGVFLVKGLRVENFYGVGAQTTLTKLIPAATTVDNIRACYWLADASTVLNTSAQGLALDTKTSWTAQNCYVLDNTGASGRCYLYNVRAALTGLASGKSTSAFTHRTNIPTLTTIGSIRQRNNGLIATTSHGPGAGVKSLYWCTESNMYRGVVANITINSTNWVSETWVPSVPTGYDSTSYSSTSFRTISYDNVRDRFYISQGGNNVRSFYTQWKTGTDPADQFLYIDDNQLDSSDSESSGVIHPMDGGTNLSTFYYPASDVLYFLVTSSTVGNNFLYVIPLGADWLTSDTSNDYIITPKLDISGASKLYRVYVNDIRKIGSATFAVQPEPWNLFYRTTGINDNSGAWTAVQGHGDLTGVAASSEIQFKMNFRVLGGYGVMNRLHNLSVDYEISSQQLDSHYRWSFADTLATSSLWGFTQVEYFYKSPPVHTIEIRRVDTSAVVLTQASTGTTNGVFEYWDGGGWVAGLGPDVKGTRRRFRATASLPVVELMAKLSVA